MKIGIFVSICIHILTFIIFSIIFYYHLSRISSNIVDPIPINLESIGKNFSVKKGNSIDKKKDFKNLQIKTENKKKNLPLKEDSKNKFLKKNSSSFSKNKTKETTLQKPGNISSNQKIKNISEELKFIDNKNTFTSEFENQKNNLLDKRKFFKDNKKIDKLGNKKKEYDEEVFKQNLNNIIGSCVSKNWDIGLIQGSSSYDLGVQANIKLNVDGYLNGIPNIIPYGGDKNDRNVIIIQALSALKKCEPFSLPPERYNEWSDIIINMKAFPD